MTCVMGMVFVLNDLNIRIVEVGTTVIVLAVFIALFAIVGYLPELKALSNILYVVLFLGYATIMCLFGLKMSPYLSP